MAELQKRIRGKPDLALVSISLNNDSPADLERFAEGLEAEPGQWFFLTGDKQFVHDLVQQSFKQTAADTVDVDPAKRILHSFNLVVVDRQGKMVGYIEGRDLSAATPVASRMRELARERYLLPSVNAGLNSLSALLLTAGYVALRRRNVFLHKLCMLSALVSSTVFLSLDLYFHFAVLDGRPTRFLGEGAVRHVYFSILISHTILAVIVAPLALTVSYLGLSNRLAGHIRLARWTLPIWLYVSITGVVVYCMLYVL